jgi:alanine racemase
MYGISPSPEIENHIPFELQESFSFKSRLSHVKKVQAGERISYGGTYQSEVEEWIGTVPVGYADGWLRKLQNQEVLIDGNRVPIIGRICMDQFMVRLPKQYEVGTLVTLIGRDGNEEISVGEVAARLETIAYEVPCIISHRVPRVYVEEGNETVVRNSVLHRTNYE